MQEVSAARPAGKPWWVMNMDPDQPTRRIAPTPPPAERVVVQDDAPAYAELAERIRSLRGWLALATALALIALGVAAWAVVTKEEEEDARAGASRGSVSRLDSRVDELESRLEDRATKGSLDEVREDQRELRDEVEQVGQRAADGGDTEAVQESVQELSEDVTQLQQRLDELEQRQDEQASP